jgi:hypothetical protein
MTRIALLLAGAALLLQEGNLDLRKALKDEKAGDEWIYDDYAAGVAAAKKDGRPMLVVFR